MDKKAFKPGLYKDFTGRIQYKTTDCQVGNATFELLPKKRNFKDNTNVWIVFEKGDVVSGEMYCVDILNCDFRGDKMLECIFRDGVFRDGKISWSHWLGGVWDEGDWLDNNFDKNNHHRIHSPDDWDDLVYEGLDVATKPGIYPNFSGQIKTYHSNFIVRNADVELTYDLYLNFNVIRGGSIVSGNVEHFRIYDCQITCDKIKESYLYRCRFKGGTAHYCSTFSTDWYKGVVKNVVWSGGTWFGGDWQSGCWRYGHNKNGNYQDFGESPDKWE